MNLKLLIIGFFIGIVGQILGWIQIYSGIVWPSLKQYTWIIVLLVSPAIGFLFVYSTKYMVEAFGGVLWPSRIIGFCAGVIVFTIATSIFMKEYINLKTFVCLMLCLVILGIQILWKTK